MHPSRPPLNLGAACTVAVLSGPVMDAAFPDLGLWPLIVPALAMQLVSLIGRRAGSAFLVAFLGALSFYLVMIPWVSSFLGDSFGSLSLLPYVALSVFESLFWGAAGVAIALAYRWVPRLAPGAAGRIVLLPFVVAGLWMLREQITSTWPFGGFSWGRLAYSQSQSLLAHLFSWIGSPGLGLVIALVTAAGVEVVRLSVAQRAVTPMRDAWRPATLRRGGILALVAVGLCGVPAFAVTTDGSMTVAAVQGNSPAGYFTPHEYGDLLKAQIDATQPLVDEGVRPDVVVWPEGATDIDPIVDANAARAFDSVGELLGAPLLSGDITQDGDIWHNSSILWEDGRSVAQYDKRHPVPFGEYVPLRSLLEPLAPSLIGLIGREYTPGTNSPVLNIDGVLAGANICFDIVDDALMVQTADDGARIVFAQSNNADFGQTDESVQQLAIARIRAMELGRSVVVISTVGQSAIITADGATLDSVPRYTAAAMVDAVPLSSQRTPATSLMLPLPWTAGLAALALLVVAGVLGRPRRRS